MQENAKVAPDAPLPDRVFVVLGMHKSGTTLLARLLSEGGIDMGQFDMERTYASGNFLEEEEFRRINVALLKCGKRSSVHVRTVLQEKDVEDDILKAGVALVAKKHSRSARWGFKDPRTVLTYRTFWKRVLPGHTIVAIYRRPQEVVARYLRGKPGIRASASRLVHALNGLAAWCVYNEELVEALEQDRSAMLLRFDLLMTSDEELHRVKSALGAAELAGCDQEQYHPRSIPQWKYGMLVRATKLFFGCDSERIFQALEELRDTQISNPP